VRRSSLPRRRRVRRARAVVARRVTLETHLASRRPSSSGRASGSMTLHALRSSDAPAILRRVTSRSSKRCYRSIYFPYPDYTTCCRMWKVFIEQYGGTLTTDFPLNTLAHMSSGYSAVAIRKTAEFVLTPFRKEKLKSRPLKLAEFIGPLSQCSVTD